MIRSTATLFRPFTLKNIPLPNRIVMAPMTRSCSPDGVPGPDVAAYYRRRAEGGVGLIVTEGTYIPHPTSGFDPNVPHAYGEASLAGWRRVVDEVHAAGGRIFMQLWHVGMQLSGGQQPETGIAPMGPDVMTQADIDAIVAAYGRAARAAKDVGFDGVELHGAHGYLIDQFFWEGTNHRSDIYGGDMIARTRFAVESLREIRKQIGPEFPVVLRYSQWKIQDYAAKLAKTPQELEQFLAPLIDAGADAFHCSTRRFWDPEFPGSDLNLAGWTKKLTGLPTITVGSVTLGADLMTSFQSSDPVAITGIDELLDRMEREEFDLIAIGRSLIANPNWPKIVGRRALSELVGFSRAAMSPLV